MSTTLRLTSNSINVANNMTKCHFVRVAFGSFGSCWRRNLAQHLTPTKLTDVKHPQVARGQVDVTALLFFARGRRMKSSRCKGGKSAQSVQRHNCPLPNRAAGRRAGSPSLAPSRYEKKPRRVFSKLSLAVSFGTSDVRVNSETNYTLRGAERSPSQTAGGVRRRSTR